MKEKMITFFDKINPYFDRLGQNKYLQTISTSMMATLGPVFLGSMSLLMVIFASTVGSKIPGLAHFVPVFNQVFNFTVGAMAIYIVFFMAKNLVTNLNPKDDGVAAGIIALMSFFIMTPGESVKIAGADVTALPTTWLGAQGVFSAMIIGLIVGRGYLYIKEKGWTIKMPASVPPMVSKVFESLIPTIILGVFFIIVSGLFAMTSFGTMHEFVYNIIQQPLKSLGGSLVAFIIVSIVQQLLWFFGIHGTNVIMPIVMPIWMAMDMENLSLVQAGQDPTNILGMAFFTTITWGGLALGLVLLMVFSKSKQYRELGKLSLVPGLFGITEPVIFGFPLVLNFKLLVPFVFNNSIALILSYVLTKMGIVSIFTGTATVFGLPVGLYAAMQGSLSIIILMLVIQLVLSPILWFPWFKWLEKETVAKEKEVGV